jgi:hypothetical protein
MAMNVVDFGGSFYLYLGAGRRASISTACHKTMRRLATIPDRQR